MFHKQDTQKGFSFAASRRELFARLGTIKGSVPMVGPKF